MFVETKRKTVFPDRVLTSMQYRLNENNFKFYTKMSKFSVLNNNLFVIFPLDIYLQ